MIAADTSAAVAAFAPWHERHREARAALSPGAAIVGQCVLETCSVLTRLPPPRRADAALVAEFLSARFPDPPLMLEAPELQQLPARLAELGISGGAAYDGLVGITAARAGATLVSCDLRARSVYARCGVPVRFI